jgi:hypothetical protein
MAHTHDEGFGGLGTIGSTETGLSGLFGSVFDMLRQSQSRSAEQIAEDARAQREVEADRLLKQRLSTIDSAFGSALQSIIGIGSANAQAIRDSALQTQGRATSGLAARGLLNTSVGGNLTRGIQADQQRSLLANSANVAGLRSNLLVQRGQDVGDAIGSIASNLIGRNERGRSYFLSRLGLQQQQDQFDQERRDARNASFGAGLGAIAGLF